MSDNIPHPTDLPYVADATMRERLSHARSGSLVIVLPVTGDSDLAGLAIFAETPEQVARIMDHDPGVQAGIFTSEIAGPAPER
jgi:hypothetical protein